MKASDFHLSIERVVMTKTAQLFAGLLALVSCLTAGSAFAQNDHSWVSSTGSGTACTRAAPCANAMTAQSVTNAGGVISILDSGAGDSVGIEITKSLTLRAEGVDGGSTLSQAGASFIFINAGPSDVVTVEGLHVNGTGGIRFDAGGHLHVVRCVITNERSSFGHGIRFRPNSPSKLSVTDTVISNMGSGTGGGIVINPNSGGSARVNLERVTVNGNLFGIAVDGTNSTAGINMAIADSMIGGNSQDGIIATTPGGGAPIGVYLKNTKSVNNAFGIRSLGANVTVRVDGSSVIGNGTGLSFSGGGALLTFGNNAVQANGTNGSFFGSVGLQ
jgi:hypothetical protein